MNNPSFWIASSAYRGMVALANEHRPKETGGMLLGYTADTGDIVVTRIIGPGPGAKHGRFRFEPDGTYQQTELEKHYRTTDGRETYLGDWHTHPSCDSTPSTLDKHTLARISREPGSQTSHPVMAILAGGSGEWSLGVVRLVSAIRRLFWFTCELEALSVIPYGSEE